MYTSIAQPVIPFPAGISTPLETSKERRERHGKGKKGIRNNSRNGATFKVDKFFGRTEELKSEIYDLTYNMSDQFTQTTRAITEHTGRTYKSGSLVKSSIKEMTEQVLHAPVIPTTPNTLEQQMWDRDVDEYTKQKNLLLMNLKTLYSLV